MLTEREWENMFGPIFRHKVLFREPYRAGVSPLVAAAIDHFKKEKIRILVVGSGNGHFSNYLYPAVHQNLHQVGNRSEVEIVESDPVGVGSAKGRFEIAHVETLKKTFGTKSLTLFWGNP